MTCKVIWFALCVLKSDVHCVKGNGADTQQVTENNFIDNSTMVIPVKSLQSVLQFNLVFERKLNEGCDVVVPVDHLCSLAYCLFGVNKKFWSSSLLPKLPWLEDIAKNTNTAQRRAPNFYFWQSYAYFTYRDKRSNEPNPKKKIFIIC